MQVTVNGKSVHYVEGGNKSGMPVIFLHCFPLNSKMWAEQQRALTSFRTVAYDFRGFGASEGADGLFMIELFVDDLLGLMDQLDIPRAVLVGLSMGGHVAQRAIERAPSRVAGLVLCDTRAESDPDQNKINRAENVRKLVGNRVDVFLDGFMPNLFSPKTVKENPKLVAAARAMALETAPTSLAGGMLALAARTDTTRALANIAVPTLLLYGEDDGLTPPAVAKAMAEKIPGAVVKLVPNGGHVCNLENPAEFNRHLGEFLARVK